MSRVRSASSLAEACFENGRSREVVPPGPPIPNMFKLLTPRSFFVWYTYAMSHANESDIPRNGMRAEGEQDRPEEYKAARDNLVISVRGLLDEVERLQADGLPLGEFGLIYDTPGISRIVLEDPFAKVSTGIMAERTKPTGAYLYHDSKTGQRSLVVVRPDKVLEILDNPMEQQVAGPEAGYEGVSSSILTSFNERQPDGSYIGAQVRASGKFSIKKFDGGSDSYHTGISLTHNPEQIEMVGDMWTDIEAQLLKQPPAHS